MSHVLSVLMPMASMAECVDVAVAAALLACVGAAHSIGNATCRTTTFQLVLFLLLCWRL